MTDADHCIFCQIIRGESNVQWVARTEFASAFLPLESSRLAPGHTLVVPNEHAIGVQDASARALTEVAILVQRVARAMTSVMGATGVNILNASGADAGQSVAHLHMHVVPRWPNDALETWPSARSLHEVRPDYLALLQMELGLA